MAPTPKKHTPWEPWFEQELKGTGVWKIVERAYTLYDRIEPFIDQGDGNVVREIIAKHLRGEK